MEVKVLDDGSVLIVLGTVTRTGVLIGIGAVIIGFLTGIGIGSLICNRYGNRIFNM